MGFFDFVKSAGRSIGILGEEKPSPQAVQLQAQAQAMAAKAKAVASLAEQINLHNEAVAIDIQANIVAHGLDVSDLVVTVASSVVTLKGKARTSEDGEKAVLVAGNTEGIDKVDDQLVITHPTAAAVHHTVVKGDLLSKIAEKHYGNLMLYNVIFEANRPMLTHPDKIYPGQVLRIPPLSGQHTHTVKSGETLGTIAKHWFGDPKKYQAIFEANKGLLPNADTVKVGQVLVIPLAK